MVAEDAVARVQGERARLLEKLYEATGGDTTTLIDFYELAATEGLSMESADQALTYLADRHLVDACLGGSVHLTSSIGQRIVEHAARGRRPQTSTGGGSIPSIVQNFHGPVGAVQTGAQSTANVTQTVGLRADTILALLKVARAEVHGLPAASRAEAGELLDEVEREVGSKQPSATRLRAFASSLQRIAEGIVASGTGSVLAQLVAELLKRP
jgi:hypothetical protein